MSDYWCAPAELPPSSFHCLCARESWESLLQVCRVGEPSKLIDDRRETKSTLFSLCTGLVRRHAPSHPAYFSLAVGLTTRCERCELEPIRQFSLFVYLNFRGILRSADVRLEHSSSSRISADVLLRVFTAFALFANMPHSATSLSICTRRHHLILNSSIASRIIACRLLFLPRGRSSAVP